MLVSESQYSNASSPILVTLSGIVMLISKSQFSNALFPILVTLPGIVKDFLLFPPGYLINLVCSLSYKTSSLDE